MNYLTKEQIIFNDCLGTKVEVIELISDKAIELGISDNKEGLVQSFIERENLGSTGFGNGLAIPHAKSEFVKEVAIIIVKSTVPVEWQSIDDAPVHIAIALLVPSENPDNIHLKVLSSISRKLVDESFTKQMFGANTGDELYELFESIVIV